MANVAVSAADETDAVKRRGGWNAESPTAVRAAGRIVIAGSWGTSAASGAGPSIDRFWPSGVWAFFMLGRPVLNQWVQWIWALFPISCRR